MIRPIWQLLLLARNTNAELDQPLSCEECMALADFLAQIIADVLEQEKLRELVLAHLACCADCRAHILRRLSIWEAILFENKDPGEQSSWKKA